MALDGTLIATGLVSLAVFVSMGTFVLLWSERGWLPIAFGTWLVTLGLIDGFLYLWPGMGLPYGLSVEIILAAIDVVAVAATVVMVVALPRFFGVRRSVALSPSLAWIGLGLLFEVAALGLLVASFWDLSHWGTLLFGVARLLQGGATLGMLLWVPSLLPDLPPESQGRVMLLCAALATTTFFLAGSDMIWWILQVHAFPYAGALLGVTLAASGLIVLRWAALERGRSPVGWAAVSLFLGSALLGELGASIGAGTLAGWWNTLWVVLTATLVGYALLRGRVVRLDVTFRWTIYRGLFPALAVATFFIVSEGAQEFFGDRLGNEYVGIVAAGLLLVALRPIQTFAGRLAERAVPGVPTVQPFAAPDAIYRHAVRAAMLDGALTAEEEAELAQLQDRLAMPAAQALAIRQDVQAGLA